MAIWTGISGHFSAHSYDIDLLNYMASRIAPCFASDYEKPLEFPQIIRLLQSCKNSRYGGTPESKKFYDALSDKIILVCASAPPARKEHLLQYAVSRMAALNDNEAYDKLMKVTKYEIQKFNQSQNLVMTLHSMTIMEDYQNLDTIIQILNRLLAKKAEQDRFYNHTKGIFNRTLLSILKVLEIDRNLILQSEGATAEKIS